MNRTPYYPQFPYATQLQTGEGYYGFEGLAEITARQMIGPKELEEKIEALVRGAALKTIDQTEVEGATEEEFEAQLYQNVLEGLAEGNTREVSETEFVKELQRRFISGLGLDAQLGLSFKSITRAITKPIKKVVKVVKKVTKPIVKAVKKVAPVVAAGAALYFTGGAAAPMLQKFSPVIGQYWGSWNKTVGKVLGQAPPTNDPGYEVQYVEDPAITQGATQMAQYQLAQQGINMNSPQAQQVLRGHIQYNQAQMAAAGRAQTPQEIQALKNASPQQLAGGTNWMKILLPVGIGAAALFMMTR